MAEIYWNSEQATIYNKIDPKLFVNEEWYSRMVLEPEKYIDSELYRYKDQYTLLLTDETHYDNLQMGITEEQYNKYKEMAGIVE